MHTYLFPNPESISQQYLQTQLLPALPEWRRQQTLRYKFVLGQVLSAKAFLLLKDGLEHDYGVTSDFHFDYLEHNKPVLREYPNIHFNLSHCKKGVLCVISNQGPVGCDIEAFHRNVSDALVRKTCNPVEIAQLNSALNPSAEFIKLWTVKEAVLKLTGRGVIDDLPSLLSPELVSTLDINTSETADFAYTTCRWKRDI